MEKDIIPSQLNNQNDDRVISKSSIDFFKKDPENNKENDNDNDDSNNNENNDNDNGNNLGYIDSDDEQEIPYTILRTNEKYIISLLLAGVGLISSLSMPIYFPILTVMERHFNVNNEKINYTVVSYLCFQAVSPVIVSSLADTYGRRPILLICLFCATLVNIGLALTNTYWLLIFLRCLLAASASPTISITTACVGDWVQRHERGKFIGIVTGFTLIGQGFAPFLGSVIDTWLGWRSVFWFSALIDFIIFLLALIFLPETKRSLIGNLSAKPLKFINKSPIVYFYKSRLIDIERKSVIIIDNNQFSIKTFLQPFKILIQIDVICILIPSSIMFAVWNTSQTSLSNSLGGSNYKLSTLKIGLCYLAPGISCMIATVLSGKLIDFFYKKSKKNYELNYSNTNTNNKPVFNLIKARLSIIYIPMLIISLASLGFGWSLNYSINLAPVLIFSILIVFGAMYPLTCSSTILVDLFPERTSVAMSLLNLLRCGTSAIFIACLDKMIKKMTYGGTYSFFAGIILISSPFYAYLLINSEKIINQKNSHH